MPPPSSIPSKRPTSVPDYDIDALAAAAFAEPRSRPLPPDLCVPTRRRASSTDGTPLRAAFLLSHVDERSTIAEIAASAQLPLADAVAGFDLLVSLGLVELRGTHTARPDREEPPKTKSGVRSKT
jgi:hypothetical protein